MLKGGFIDDKCKVADMIRCGKDEFLRAYSYLSEDVYDTTFRLLMHHLEFEGCFSESSIEEYRQVESEVHNGLFGAKEV